MKFIYRRIISFIPLLLGITFLYFIAMQFVPGDYFTKMELNPQIPQKTVEQLRHQYGIDDNVFVQYFKWVKNLSTLNLGYSLEYKADVWDLIKQRMFNTILLSICAMGLTWLMAIPLGIFAAKKHSSIYDKLISVLAFLGMSIPNFFLAFIMLYFAVKTNYFPIGGGFSLEYDSLSLIGKIIDRSKHLFIPVFVLATGSLASLQRIMRSNMLEILGREYITTARSKGLKEKRVIFLHALRPALNPFITILGFQISDILSGAAIVEIITAYPGMGQLILNAALSDDRYLVMGSMVVGAVMLIIGNLIADILLQVSDPRVRVG